MTARSKPTLTLIDYRLWPVHHKIGQPFQAEKLNGSTNYTIGQWFTKRQVDEIIRSGWNVNLRGPKRGEL